ncbi:Vacuolar protein sorting-associated protein 1 [Mycena sanguinolenta]|uniref:Vacuolar protein sorting-associated protein 1 n=1 Tax=Mycena sanguinolenta TaxID=230812 RepID=A0A8H6XLF6_9AGAR|nr:Vacuolar protein sorting-associated protein 1 [Mycena sanguinolenta]
MLFELSNTMLAPQKCSKPNAAASAFLDGAKGSAHGAVPGSSVPIFDLNLDVTMGSSSKSVLGLGFELLPIINQLQASAVIKSNTAQIHIDLDLDLPRICVLGNSSNGKSSVLNIVGQDFLPRAPGIVTRRPLWGELLYLPGRKFFSFDKIRDEIARHTASHIRHTDASTSAELSPVPINLRIYSPDVRPLTLIDLPGILRIPQHWQEKQMRGMHMAYISGSNVNSIILVASGANQDLTNCEGMKLAREVDPEGMRTIRVLTKIDVMDPGIDVIDTPANRVISLPLGYVPVVNRGHRLSSLPMGKALNLEREFFANHPAYSAKAQFCGTPYLVRKINSVPLNFHFLISPVHPWLSSNFPFCPLDPQTAERVVAELYALADPVAKADHSKAYVLGTVIKDFTREFRIRIDGALSSMSLHSNSYLSSNAKSLSSNTSSSVFSNNNSSGGSIAFIFHQLYRITLENIDPFDQVKDADIRTVFFSVPGTVSAPPAATCAFAAIVK